MTWYYSAIMVIYLRNHFNDWKMAGTTNMNIEYIS